MTPQRTVVERIEALADSIVRFRDDPRQAVYDPTILLTRTNHELRAIAGELRDVAGFCREHMFSEAAEYVAARIAPDRRER